MWFALPRKYKKYKLNFIRNNKAPCGLLQGAFYFLRFEFRSFQKLILLHHQNLEGQDQ